MIKLAVVKSGGKQYLVKENDEIVVDRLPNKEKETIKLDTLAVISDDKIELGKPILTEKTTATLIANVKGDKIRVAKFKSKVRYRKVMGFRPYLSKIKINKI